MRSVSTCLVVAILSLCASRAESGLVVTSYQTLASTNGYAPTTQTQYFSEQRLDNLSPAVAEVSGDWTGPNANGTPNTWHFVGTSRASSTTTITSDSYTVEAAASFSYIVDTTAEFSDPRSINTYGPSGTAYYNGFFETDVVLKYSVSVLLNQRGRVRLNQIGGPEVFDESNTSLTPRFVNLSGSLAPGRYSILAGSGLSSGVLPNGINQYGRSGSLENFVFAAQVPEPSSIVLGLACFILCHMTFRRMCRSSDRPSR